MIRKLMYLPLDIIGKLFGWDKQNSEYFEKFIIPELKRAKAMNIPDQILNDMFSASINEADYQLTFPAMLLRDKIDRYKLKHNEGSA